MRNAFTDKLGAEMTAAKKKAKMSYPAFFISYAKKKGWDYTPPKEEMVASYDWDKCYPKPKRYIYTNFLYDGHVLEVYHWYGDANIYVKK